MTATIPTSISRMAMRAIAILVISLVAMTAGSCRKRYINGRLDGQWQIMQIELKAEPQAEPIRPERTYYCLMRTVVNLTGVGKATQSGNISYHYPELKLQMPYSSAASLEPWGMNSTETTFQIRELSGGRMTLESDYAVITFRKF